MATYVVETSLTYDDGMHSCRALDALPNYCMLLACGGNALGENLELLVEVPDHEAKAFETFMEGWDGLDADAGDCYERVEDDGAQWRADREARGLCQEIE